MIIDSHTHIGNFTTINMEPEMLINAMDKKGIEFSLASNIEGIEFSQDGKKLKYSEDTNQINVNKRMIDIANNSNFKLGALIWIRPNIEGCTPDFEEFVEDNIQNIFGIKCHPFYSNLAFDNPKFVKYIHLAKKFKLPIVVHTATDEFSSPYKVYKMAVRFPEINFLMVHMGLGTDNEEAIKLISLLPNLYGDTTWVKPEKVLRAIKVCGSFKILFGTDAPINGKETYEDSTFYTFYWDEIKKHITKDEYKNLMFNNAINFFKIKY